MRKHIYIFSLLFLSLISIPSTDAMEPNPSASPSNSSNRGDTGRWGRATDSIKATAHIVIVAAKLLRKPLYSIIVPTVHVPTIGDTENSQQTP